MTLLKTPDLSGKVAVVTGGAGVLCSGFCRALAQHGASVAILNRTLSKAEKLAEQLRGEGLKAQAFQVDCTDSESVKTAHEAVLNALGPCDILINGAGGNDASATADDEFFSMETLKDPEKKSFFDLTQSAFTKVFDQNIMGVLLPTQAFALDMAEKGSGVILNISSMNGVSNFTQWLAVHFAKSGIRVNAIAPGFFSAQQNAKLLWNEDGSPTERTKKILAGTPMGRFGRPEELIGAVLFLCDDERAGFVTGVVLPVDGGFGAYSGV